MHLICGNHHPACRNLIPNELWGEIFALGNKLHFGGDITPPGRFKLCHGVSHIATRDLNGLLKS